MSTSKEEVENIYTSVACNVTVEAADWGNNGIIAYGANNAVVLFDPKYAGGKSAKIIHTYANHKKRVNTVRWLRTSPTEKETILLSGSDDATAILWNITDRHNPKWIQLKGHESGVNAVYGLQYPKNENNWLLATGAADSTLKLWRSDGEHVQCTQTLFLNGGYCFTLRLALFPGTQHILLAFSTDDATISLWVQEQQLIENETSNLFLPIYKLTGHEDWVRCLDFIIDGDDLLLASSSQDNFIRLWRISPRTQQQVSCNALDIVNLMYETQEIKVEEKIIQLRDKTWYAFTLESVLYGHDGWVYGIQWHQSEEHGFRLLSASIDKTIIVWAPNKECDDVWMESVRLGEVGGNSLGFFGARFSGDGRSICGHSYQGGLHLWEQSTTDESDWMPTVIVGGHFGEVRDLAWEPNGGEYLMTVSSDQTTRIHAPWIAHGTWHELARPQVHGYDMQALAMISRYKFASGAEEKIVRVFQAPGNFIENFQKLVGIEKDIDSEGNTLLSLPKGASVPSLGLSNKAVYDVEEVTPSAEKHVKDVYPENYFVPVALDTPPQEEMLMQNTLWPEVQKLYGHGFEIYSLAASPDGQLLASSCRATTAEHAQIILWNTNKWKQIQKLPSHQLTVTQMRFSPDGRYLLSVSRDRRWSLFERVPQDDNSTSNIQFQLTAFADKTNAIHARIIWTCDWSHDSKYFVTASRDGKAVIWTQSDNVVPVAENSLKGWQAAAVLEQKNASMTAVAFASEKTCSDKQYIIALGYESGCINIYRFDGKWIPFLSLDNDQSHHLTVKRLQFRPKNQKTKTNQQKICLASCGEDHLVRIYEFNV